MKMSKAKVLTVLVACILILIMLFGALSGASSTIISGSSNTLNNSSGSGSNNQNTGGNSGTIIPDEEPRVPFGGTNFLTLDFEDIEYSNDGDKILFKNNINSSNATNVKTSIEGGKFKAAFNYDSSNTVSDSSHFGFGIAANYEESCYSLFDKDFFTIDVDYTVDNFYGPFSIYLMVRRGIGDYAISGARILGSLNDDGCINLTTNRNSDTFVTNYDSFHLTCVYEINHSNLAASRVLFYIDGVYFTSLDYLADGAIDFCTLRFHCLEAVWKTLGTIYADNVSFNSFGDGSGDYNGVLVKLFDDPYVNLKDCTDSILFEE